MALRLESCLPRAIISMSGRRRRDVRDSSMKRSRSDPTAAPRPETTFAVYPNCCRMALLGMARIRDTALRSTAPVASICRFTGRDPVLKRMFAPKALSTAR